MNKLTIEKHIDPKAKRKKLMKDLDTAWGKRVRERAGNICEVTNCGRYGNHPHHIITRSVTALRWEMQNGICLCPLHHTLGQSMSAHKAPREFQAWLDRAFPGRYEMLAIRKRNRLKTDLWTLEMIKKEMEK